MNCVVKSEGYFQRMLLLILFNVYHVLLHHFNRLTDNELLTMYQQILFLLYWNNIVFKYKCYNTSFGILVKTRLICCKVSCLSQCIVSQKMYVFCIRKLNEFLTVNSSVGKIQVQNFEKLWELFALHFESFAILRWFGFVKN